MFEVAAEAYDRFMGRYSAQLAPPLADFGRVRAGQRVLDVGCGPGALTAELVARVGADAVAAVDPSESFVAAARARYPEVDVRHASAEHLPFDDAVFDAALAQLVVHFMSDPVGGLRELKRVTAPGGTVAACVWAFLGDDRLWLVAIASAAILLPVTAIFGCERGWPRTMMTVYTLVVIGFGVVALVELFFSNQATWFSIFVMSAVVSTWIAAYLTRQTPTK